MILDRLLIRQKVNLLVLFPMVLVVLLLVPQLIQRVHDARIHRQTAQTAEAARQVSGLVEDVQLARLLSVSYLDAKNQVSADDLMLQLQTVAATRAQVARCARAHRVARPGRRAGRGGRDQRHRRHRAPRRGLAARSAAADLRRGGARRLRLRGGEPHRRPAADPADHRRQRGRAVAGGPGRAAARGRGGEPGRRVPARGRQQPGARVPGRWRHPATCRRSAAR